VDKSGRDLSHTVDKSASLWTTCGQVGLWTNLWITPPAAPILKVEPILSNSYGGGKEQGNGAPVRFPAKLGIKVRQPRWTFPQVGDNSGDKVFHRLWTGLWIKGQGLRPTPQSVSQQKSRKSRTTLLSISAR
jgi:hypothetical protein